MAKKKVVRKAKKPKVKSPTQKKIEGKIKYQQFKLRKIKSELSDLTFNLREKSNLEKEFENQNLNLISLRDIDKTIKKGKQYKFKTIYSGVLNEGTKINTGIFKLKNKLNRFKKPVKTEKDLYLGANKPDGVYRTVIRSSNPNSKTVEAHVWDTADIERSVLSNPEISKLNGISIVKDKNKVLDYLNDLKTQMGSSSALMLVYGNDMNAKLIIINPDDIDKIENKKPKTKKSNGKASRSKNTAIKKPKKRNT